VIAELPLGVEGVLDAGLPAPGPPTPYSRYGALAPLLLWLAFLSVCVFAKRRFPK
jgi:apolipoprotein N-acyltransferase